MLIPEAQVRKVVPQQSPPQVDSFAQQVHEVALLGFTLLTGAQAVYSAIISNVEILKEAGKSLLVVFVLGVLHEMLWAKPEVREREVQREVEAVKKPPGLRNSGTTCFINTALQCLLACGPYRKAIYATAKQEIKYYTAWDKFENAVLQAEVEPWKPEEVQGVMICLVRYQGWKQALLGLDAEFERLFNQFDTAYTTDLPWPQVEEAGVKVFTAQLEKFTRSYVERIYSFRPIFDFLEVQKTLRPQELMIPAFAEKCKEWEQEAAKVANLEPLFRAYAKHWNAFAALEKLFGPDSQPIDGEAIRPLLSASSSGQEDIGELIQRIVASILRCPEYPELFFTLETHRKSREVDNAVKTMIDSQKTYIIPLEVPQKATVAQELIDAWSRWAEPLEKYPFAGGTIEGEMCRLKELPKCLMIHLKRCGWRADETNKLETVVAFTEEVTIQGQLYRIVAGARHIGGSADKGHYTALVDRGDTWWYCSDTEISEATKWQKEKTLSEGCLYFLKKVKTADVADG